MHHSNFILLVWRWIEISNLQNIKIIFIKAIKSPVILLLLIEGIVLGVLYKYGFRITYSPDLEVSWNAISAIGQWAGVLVGFLIPIAAVYLQSKLDKSKKDIGESNIALFKEFESFKKEYEDKLKHLSSHFDGQGNSVINGEGFEGHKEERRSKEELKNEAHKFINISMLLRPKILQNILV